MTQLLKIFIASILILTFSSCTVEGDEISGIWYTNGELGKMKIDIKSSNGKFVGYLLEYEKNGKLLQNDSKNKNLILEGLEFKENKFLGGKFLQNPKGGTACEFKMTYYTEDRTSMRVAHKCNGTNRLEMFERAGYPEKPYFESRVKTVSLDKLLKANPNNKKN